MVYVDSRNLGYQPYVWRWLNSRTRPGEAEALRQLFDKYVAPVVDWVCDGVDGVDLVKRPKQSIPHTNLNMVAQLCDLLAATLVDHPKLQDPAVSWAQQRAAACSGMHLQQHCLHCMVCAAASIHARWGSVCKLTVPVAR
jgi:hypothetical protein